VILLLLSSSRNRRTIEQGRSSDCGSIAISLFAALARGKDVDRLRSPFNLIALGGLNSAERFVETIGRRSG
jgi:hypothetical protein